MTVETYYRLFLEDAVPPSVDRILYLDVDLVVLSDLSPLIDIDLQGRTVGAVRDFWVFEWSRSSLPLPAADPAGRNPYFNAGVLVIDVERWKRTEVCRRALHFLLEHAGSVRYWDQDALNFALAHDWLELDPRWNRASSYWHLRGGSLPFDPATASALATPFIVHFVTHEKPWVSYRHPDRKHFDRFALMAGFGQYRMTFWKDVRRRVRRRLNAVLDAHRSGRS